MEQQDSPAVALARAHAEAWSNHDWDKARAMLARDVHVISQSIQPGLPATDVIGVDDYMEGLKKFAQAVVPGSARLVASIGDKRSSLILLTVAATIPDGAKVTLPAARLALWDENRKMIQERVIFFALSD
jgi:hypothetical protein